MDRQAWIAVTLCIIGLIAWQVYMAKHPAPVPAKISASPSPAPGVGQDSVEPGATVATSLPSPAPGSTESRPTSAATPPNEATPTPAPFVEKTTTLRNADLELLLTNRGGGIAEAILPKHKGENGARGEVECASALADRRDYREACGAGARGVFDRAGGGHRAVRAAR